MNFFSELNKKLDEGWKLTDSNCPICRSSIIYNPKDKQLFCLKCNIPCKIDAEIIDPAEQKQDQKKSLPADDKSKKNIISSSDDEEEEEYEFKWHMAGKGTAGPSRTDQVSKLLAQRMLQGYAMLEECCSVCMSPIMRSKAQQYECVGCGYVKNRKQFDDMINGVVETEVPAAKTTVAPTVTATSAVTTATSVAASIIQASAAVVASTSSTATIAPVKAQILSQQIQSAALPRIQSEGSTGLEESRSDLLETMQRSLNRVARHYEDKIKRLEAEDNTKEIASLIATAFKPVIEMQKLLDETK